MSNNWHKQKIHYDYLDCKMELSCKKSAQSNKIQEKEGLVKEMGGEKRGGRRINRVKGNEPDDTRSMKSATSQKYIREIKKTRTNASFF